MTSVPSVSDIVRKTALDQAQTKYPLPAFVTIGIDLFEKAHVIFRSIKYSQIIRDQNKRPDQPNSLVLGAALSTLAPLTDASHYGLQVVLITKCVNDIMSRYEELYLAYNNTLDTIIAPPRRLHTYSNDQSFSASQLRFFDENIASIPDYIAQEFNYISKVFAKIFNLSMALQDVRLLSQGDASQHVHACTELVNDWQKYLTELKNPKFLIKEMSTNSVLADTLLSKINANSTAAKIIDTIQQTFNEIKDHPLVISVADTTTETVLDLSGNSGSPGMVKFMPKSPVNRELASSRFTPWAGQDLTIQVEDTTTEPEKFLSPTSIATKSPRSSLSPRAQKALSSFQQGAGLIINYSPSSLVSKLIVTPISDRIYSFPYHLLKGDETA